MAAMEAMDDALNKSATLSLLSANGGDKRNFTAYRAMSVNCTAATT